MLVRNDVLGIDVFVPTISQSNTNTYTCIVPMADCCSYFLLPSTISSNAETCLCMLSSFALFFLQDPPIMAAVAAVGAGVGSEGSGCSDRRRRGRWNHLVGLCDINRACVLTTELLNGMAAFDGGNDDPSAAVVAEASSRFARAAPLLCADHVNYRGDDESGSAPPGLTEYYHCVAEAMTRCHDPQSVVAFLCGAITASDIRRTAAAASGVGVDGGAGWEGESSDATRQVLLAKMFKHSLDAEIYDVAFQAVQMSFADEKKARGNSDDPSSSPNTAESPGVDFLRQLVSVLCVRGKIDILCALPCGDITILSQVEQQLEWHADHSDVLSCSTFHLGGSSLGQETQQPDYHAILYSFHVHHGNYRKVHMVVRGTAVSLALSYAFVPGYNAHHLQCVVTVASLTHYCSLISVLLCVAFFLSLDFPSFLPLNPSPHSFPSFFAGGNERLQSLTAPRRGAAHRCR